MKIYTINDLVEAAYNNDIETVNKCLLRNIDIDSRAEYSLENLKAIPRLEYLLESNINQLHPHKWSSCCFRNECLNNFTALAAAIMGCHEELAIKLISREYNSSINVTVNLIPLSNGKYIWNHPVHKVSMLSLALLTKNANIVATICSKLEQQERLSEAIQVEIEMIYNNEILSKVNPLHIAFKLYDYQSFEAMIKHISSEPKNVLAVYETFKQNIAINRADYIKLITAAESFFSKPSVVAEMISQKLILDAAKNTCPEFTESIIQYLDPFQTKQLLAQEMESNSDNNNELHSAILLQSTTLVKQLLNQNDVKDINQQNNDGNTALHLAMLLQYCDYEIIKLLIEHGININLRNNHDKSALDLCRTPLLRRNVMELYENKFVKHKEKDEKQLILTTTTESNSDTIQAIPDETSNNNPPQTIETGCFCGLPLFGRHKYKAQRTNHNRENRTPAINSSHNLSLS